MRPLGVITVSVLALALLFTAVVLSNSNEPVVTTTTTSTSTTTTIARERAQAGWAVATSSARGVMVDYKMIDVSGVMFRAIRLRVRTTLLRWHVGSQDPPTRLGEVPADARESVNWLNEGVAGVVAVFNGGFKVSANGGGSMADGLTFSPMIRGDMTFAIDAAGHWKMGRWEPGFPGPHFHAIECRQNLGPLVADAKVTAAVRSSAFLWGSPLKNNPLEPRTALGLDVHGNLVYVATMSGVTPQSVAEALLSAGAVEGMQLDINPYWPILGASFQVLHQPGNYPVQIPGAEHSPTIYNTGWERDFFVAMAEPNNWKCSWTSPGLAKFAGFAQPQPLREVCAGGAATSKGGSVAG